jgi:diadenosine tetraphosphatase ApaH/serine/threonine PP2A family protein phosphatase
MRIALFSDIHANREAFAACLEHAQRQNPDRIVLLGDYVGYGADPEWVVRRVMDLVSQGALAVLGNHDQAVFKGNSGLNPTAAAAINWTRQQLSPEAQQFLRSLPLEEEEEDRLYVHADASDPAAWIYVTEQEDARRSLGATHQRLTFCGHVHAPRLYGITAAEKLTAFRPISGVAVPLPRPRQWLAVLGAVGQPRDGDPAACYGLYDSACQQITWQRVPYDAAAAGEKIRDAGLPESLAARLLRGL